MQRILLAAFCLAVMVGGSCRQVPERQWERGFFEPIGGKPFRLPNGVAVFSCFGYEDEIPTSFLPLELVIRNTTPKAAGIRMPAGLVFEPNDPEYQYMILLQPFSFTAPADTDTVCLLPTYCCNFDLDTPDEESNYAIAIQVWERELNELFDLVKDKRLDTEDAVDLAQDALYEITDGNGLTDSTRAALQRLP